MRRTTAKKGDLVARDIHVGDRVKFSAEAYSHGIVQRGTTRPTKGTVVDGDRWLGLKVLRDGVKRASWYHESFWERASKPRKAVS